MMGFDWIDPLSFYFGFMVGFFVCVVAIVIVMNLIYKDTE